MTAARARLTLVAVALAAVACGSPDRPSPEAAAPATTTSVSDVPAAAPSGVPADDALDPSNSAAVGDAPVASPPPSTVPATTTTPPAERPTLYIPAQGEYVYDVTGHVETSGVGGGRRPLPPVSVDTVAVSGPADRQRLVVATRDGDEGVSQEVEVVVTATEARLIRLTYRPGGRGPAYDVRPDPLPPIAHFPYVAGHRWEIAWQDRALGVSGAGTGSITGPETVTTPAGSYDAMVISVDQRIRGTVDGNLSVTSWIDPASGTVVQQHLVTDMQDMTGASHSESTRVLRQRPA